MKPLLADPVALKLVKLLPQPELIVLVVGTSQPMVHCPRCRHISSKVHSRYQRRVADLPWQGLAVRLELHACKFFCINHRCPRKIFCERLPTVVAPYAHRTLRLNEALTRIGFALGGEAGARLATGLSMNTSPATLLRRVRQEPIEEIPNLQILGVDDFAFRRAYRYGTILVDQERRRPIDLLPNSEAKTFSAWLRAHPGVQIITRDRGRSYADGASEGAPDAVQIADRCHLCKNLVEVVERVLARQHKALRRAAADLKPAQLIACSQPQKPAAPAPAKPTVEQLLSEQEQFEDVVVQRVRM